jgi:hypothetical protein
MLRAEILLMTELCLNHRNLPTLSEAPSCMLTAVCSYSALISQMKPRRIKGKSSSHHLLGFPMCKNASPVQKNPFYFEKNLRACT